MSSLSAAAIKGATQAKRAQNEVTLAHNFSGFIESTVVVKLQNNYATMSELCKTEKRRKYGIGRSQKFRRNFWLPTTPGVLRATYTSSGKNRDISTPMSASKTASPRQMPSPFQSSCRHQT